MESLRNYLNSLPVVEQESYARRASTSIGYLRKALSVGQRFDGALARRLDEESGGQVSRHDLRPDVFGERECASRGDHDPDAGRIIPPVETA